MSLLNNGPFGGVQGLDALELLRGNSPQKLGGLLEACRDYLLLIANQELDPGLAAKAGASDLVQETFLIARRELAQFRGQTREEFFGWLRQILLHHLADLRRRYLVAQKRAAEREVSLDGYFGSAAEAIAADISTPSSHFLRGELVEAVEAAVERLPESYRAVIRLRHVEQLPFRDVAERLELTGAAARKLWARAIDRLRRDLRGQGFTG